LVIIIKKRLDIVLKTKYNNNIIKKEREKNMKSYVSLERAKGVDKDALIDSAFEKFNKQNVDKDGNYVKYSDLENNFDGVTQMYEGLNQLKDALIDYIEVIQTVKGIVKNKLRNGNFDVDKEVKDKLFYETKLSKHKGQMRWLCIERPTGSILLTSAFEEDAKKITDFQNKHKQWVHNGGVVKFLTEGKIYG